MIAVAYMIHRVGRDPGSRRLNLDKAYLWFRWLVDTLPDWAILAPWLPYCEALDEERYRERGMRDGRHLADLGGIRCGIVVGPELTTGCEEDCGNLAALGTPSVDLTPLGFEVPPPDFGNLRRCLEATLSLASESAFGLDVRRWVIRPGTIVFKGEPREDLF